MKITTIMSIIAIVFLGGSANAQETETMASQEEAAKVNETLGKIGCKAGEVEKEASQLFEVDDAQCEIGQYDIKLDGEYNILSMTKDF